MQPRSSRAPFTILPATLLALVCLGASAAGAGSVSRSFDVAPGGQLLIDSDLGSIQVRSGSGDQVEVQITTSGSAADKFQPSFSQDGDRVTVLGKYAGKNSWFNWFGQPKVQIVVRVPERFDVDLETSGGSIAVDDLEGEVRSKTSGGSLSFGNIRGPVTGETSGGSIRLDASVGSADLDTSGGSIRIGDVDGDVRAETSGGSIQIERARGSVQAETSGGSIRVQEVMGAIRASTSGGSIEANLTQQPLGDCRLTTSGGGITARLAPDLSLDVEAHASGGGVSTDLDIAAERKSRSSLIGQMNSGGPELYLRTSGGRIKILGR